MSKRSNFKRMKGDCYDTPYEAVIPLLPFLEPSTHFAEPCAGKGALVDHLTKHNHICRFAGDIEPRRDDIVTQDSIDLQTIGISIITNPPWTREILHPMIENFRQFHCWLLFDSDWMHTKQAEPYLKYCSKIVSIGRVKWIPDSKMMGKDNACWYQFGPQEWKTEFYGRK